MKQDKTTLQKGQMVISLCGNDCGKYYFIIDKKGEFLSLVDGKKRTLEKPKKKRWHHVKPVGGKVDFDLFFTDTKSIEEAAKNSLLNKQLVYYKKVFLKEIY